MRAALPSPPVHSAPHALAGARRSAAPRPTVRALALVRAPARSIEPGDVDAQIALLPVYLASCTTFLALFTDSYLARLWCVVELFVWMHVGDHAAIAICLPHGLDGRARPLTRADTPPRARRNAARMMAGCVVSPTPLTTMAAKARASPGAASRHDADATDIWADGAAARATVVAHARRKLAAFSARAAECASASTHDRLLLVIETGFGDLEQFDAHVRSVLDGAVDEAAERLERAAACCASCEHSSPSPPSSWRRRRLSSLSLSMQALAVLAAGGGSGSVTSSDDGDESGSASRWPSPPRWTGGSSHRWRARPPAHVLTKRDNRRVAPLPPTAGARTADGSSSWSSASAESPFAPDALLRGVQSIDGEEARAPAFALHVPSTLATIVDNSPAGVRLAQSAERRLHPRAAAVLDPDGLRMLAASLSTRAAAVVEEGSPVALPLGC